MARVPSTLGPVYIIFDGPPEHEAGRFVEVEDAEGKSHQVGTWEKRGDGYWRLGPFVDGGSAARLQEELNEAWAAYDEMKAKYEAAKP